jgi:hypothetical protein
MRFYKILFVIILTTAILIFIIGLYLIENQIRSTGFTANRIGEVFEGQITGFGGILIGLFLFVLSIMTYRMYKTEKKKFDEME